MFLHLCSTIMMRLLEIFRATYNTTLPGGDGRTPAMRLGLLEKSMALQDIIAFLPGA